MLGRDNHLLLPTEVERDPQGVALTQNYLVYDSVPSNTNTWVGPLNSTTVFVKSLTIVCTRHRDSFLKIVSVSSNSFCSPPTPVPTSSFFGYHATAPQANTPPVQKLQLSRPSFENLFLTSYLDTFPRYILYTQLLRYFS